MKRLWVLATVMSLGLLLWPTHSTANGCGLGEATVLFDFDSTDEEELSVSEGEVVIIMRDYDEWLFVENRDCDQGYVPASYLERSGEQGGDADCDAIGDPCDPCPYDPDNDADGDGLCGDVDNCPRDYNPSQMDTDDDTAGNACDSNDDNDAIPDGDDNCPNIPNSDQSDEDGDGIGDECDVDYSRALLQTCEDQLAQCCPHLIPAECGDGKIQWKAGETCDPPGSSCGNGWVCDDLCQCVPLPPLCGDGKIQWRAGEQCEPAPGLDRCGPGRVCDPFQCVCVPQES